VLVVEYRHVVLQERVAKDIRVVVGAHADVDIAVRDMRIIWAQVRLGRQGERGALELEFDIRQLVVVRRASGIV
jgi:hypothetical protein